MERSQKITGSKLSWLGLSVVLVLLDQGTKYLAEQYLEYAEAYSLLPVFDFTLVYNSGAAFSFLADAGGWQRWFFALLATAVSLALIVWIKRLRRDETLLAIALAMILGGALGNLYDRVALGYVIDFISVHYKHYYFPAFNLADSAISIGAALLILDTFIHRKTAD